MRSRITASLLTLGVLTLGAGATGMVAAHAAGAPGSNFGNVDINVTATGLRSPFYSHSGEDVEGQAPYAFASLTSGGTGSALTSVFWPGGTGGNGGSTLKLLAGGCVPPNPGNTVPIPIPVPLPVPVPCVYHTPELPDPVYQATNDSYKAEVQSSDKQTTVKKSNPGVDMVATANDKETSASTVIAGAKVASGDTFGTTTSSSVIKLTGPNTAVIDAVSLIRDVKIGGGALTINSVKSVAHAVTDGKKASGSTGTVVNGMKIAGVPVTVDNKGVHIQGQGSALPSLDALNSALKKAGVMVFVANPTKKVKGASVNLFSGQLVVMQDNPQYTSNANDTALVMSFGGASIAADTNRAFQFSAPPPVTTPPAASAPQSSGTPGSSTTVPGTTPSAPDVAGSEPTAAPPLLAAAQTKLPGGIAAGWVVLALLGAGLIAAGLKRLPDRVLAATGGACSLGSDS